MRILLITHCGVKGGTGLRALELGRGLAGLGHEIHLVARNDTDRWMPRSYVVDEVMVYESPLGRGQRWAALEAMPWDLLCRKFIALKLPTFSAAIAFDMLPNNSGIYEHIRWRDNCIGIVDWADLWTEGGILYEVNRPSWMRRWSHKLEVQSKREADGVVAISNYLYRKALSIGVSNDRLLLLPAGADTHRLRPLPKDSARLRVGLDASNKIIGAIGYTGGDHVLFNAVVPILRDDPDVRLLIIGRKSPELDRAAQSMGLSEQLLQPGYQDPNGALQDYLSAVDVFAVTHTDTPNNWARWPQRVGSILAVGRPFVANKIGELIEFLEVHEVGLLAEDTSTDFANKIRILLADPTLSESLGRNGRRVAEQELSWPLLSTQLERFIIHLHHERERQCLSDS